FLRVLSPTVGIHPGIAPEFKVARFLWRKRQRKRLHAMAETFEKGVGICLILETRHKVISKPVQIRCPPAVTPNPPLEPEIENIMEVCVGKERRENRALRRSDLRGLHEPVFMIPALSIRWIRRKTRSSPIRCRRNFSNHL